MADTLDRDIFKSRVATLDLVRDLDESGREPTLSFRRPPSHGGQTPQLHTLPEVEIADSESVADTAELIVQDTLGQGGMGVVRLAKQKSLDRDVAVKTVRDDQPEAAAKALLQEAYVTGYLEHPNIIPIYTVGRNGEGAPLIVMKRVEGSSWRERLQAGEAPPLDLEREIEVLIQVTDAIRFAHSRDVIHRDIKTENVMLGDFGEVYLLDWGIAVSLDDDRPLLPTVDDEDDVVGTPGYMPPEMVLQDTSALGTRTDVYLLGATLHDILTGQPRHDGETVLDMLYSAHTSEPYDYGDEIPEQLAAIANRACHRDPEERFPSADAFGGALRDFLRRRESIAVSASADEKYQRLEELLDTDEPDEAAIHDTYGECRFGYDQALRMWEDNPKAIEGLQQCLEAMCIYHVETDRLDAARAFLADLPRPNPDLQSSVDELAARLEDEQQDLERLKEMERDLDLTTSRSKRSLLMIIFGVIWTATSLYGALTHGGEEITDAERLDSHMVSGFRNLAIAAVGIFAFRKPIFANAANARLAYLLLAFIATLAGVRWSTWYLGAEIQISRMSENALAILLLIAIGLVTDLRICLFALIYVALGAATILVPEYYPYTRPAAIAVTFFGFAWLWSPSQMKKQITL